MGQDTAGEPRLKSAHRLPSAPGIAVRVVELCREGESDARGSKHIAALIASDPALAARILKVANSPATGVSREVVSIREAVLLLGVRSVKLAALGFSLAVPEEVRELSGFDLQAYWTLSHATAVIARAAAKRAGIGEPEEAYTAGLLSGVGQLALAQTLPAEYRDVTAAAGRVGSIAQAERDAIGTDHAEFGAQMLDDWGIPEVLVQAVQWQFEPAKATPRARAVAEVVRVSRVLASALVGSGAGLEPAKEAAIALLRLDSAGWDEFASEIEDEIADISGDLRRTLSPQGLLDLKAEATEEAARAGVVGGLRAGMGGAEPKGELLAGVLERPDFEALLTELCQKAAAEGSQLGLVLVEPDDFERFKRERGAPAAARALGRMSGAIRGVLREGQAAGRCGGNVLGVLLPGATRESACIVASRLRQVIDEAAGGRESGQQGMTASIGVVLRGDFQAPPTPAEMKAMVTRQVYLSRLAGGNTWSYYGQTAAKVLKRAIA